MKSQLTIGELESAINRFKRAHRFSNCILPAELRLMASLYGRMIYHRLLSYDLTLESVETQQAIQRWSESD